MFHILLTLPSILSALYHIKSIRIFPTHCLISEPFMVSLLTPSSELWLLNQILISDWVDLKGVMWCGYVWTVSRINTKPQGSNSSRPVITSEMDNCNAMTYILPVLNVNNTSTIATHNLQQFNAVWRVCEEEKRPCCWMHPTEPMNRFNPLTKTLDTILNKEMASIKVSWHAQINLSRGWCLKIFCARYWMKSEELNWVD